MYIHIYTYMYLQFLEWVQLIARYLFYVQTSVLPPTSCSQGHPQAPERIQVQTSWRVFHSYLLMDQTLYHLKDTPPKFNMEPENDGFQKESPFPGVDFQVPS